MELDLDMEMESGEYLTAGGCGTERRVHPWDERVIPSPVAAMEGLYT